MEVFRHQLEAAAREVASETGLSADAILYGVELGGREPRRVKGLFDRLDAGTFRWVPGRGAAREAATVAEDVRKFLIDEPVKRAVRSRLGEDFDRLDGESVAVEKSLELRERVRLGLFHFNSREDAAQLAAFATRSGNNAAIDRLRKARRRGELVDCSSLDDVLRTTASSSDEFGAPVWGDDEPDPTAYEAHADGLVITNEILELLLEQVGSVPVALERLTGTLRERMIANLDGPGLDPEALRQAFEGLWSELDRIDVPRRGLRGRDHNVTRRKRAELRQVLGRLSERLARDDTFSSAIEAVLERVTALIEIARRADARRKFDTRKRKQIIDLVSRELAAGAPVPSDEALWELISRCTEKQLADDERANRLRPDYGWDRDQLEQWLETQRTELLKAARPMTASE